MTGERWRKATFFELFLYQLVGEKEIQYDITSPFAEIHLFETGHFALETHGQEIASLVEDFLLRVGSHESLLAARSMAAPAPHVGAVGAAMPSNTPEYGFVFGPVDWFR